MQTTTTTWKKKEKERRKEEKIRKNKKKKENDELNIKVIKDTKVPSSLCLYLTFHSLMCQKMINNEAKIRSGSRSVTQT